jgi:hypothetical protein
MVVFLLMEELAEMPAVQQEQQQVAAAVVGVWFV